MCWNGNSIKFCDSVNWILTERDGQVTEWLSLCHSVTFYLPFSHISVGRMEDLLSVDVTCFDQHLCVGHAITTLPRGQSTKKGHTLRLERKLETNQWIWHFQGTHVWCLISSKHVSFLRINLLSLKKLR